ncbi:MAG: TolC family protein, partial [Desulfobacterales bacterium]|nr:TolC family protein [Desulfobacterales bacterium]
MNGFKQKKFFPRRIGGGATAFLVLLLIGGGIIPATGLTAGAPHGRAAEVRMLTIDEALATAAERNRDIRKAREYIAHVHGRYVEERAAAFPQLTLTASLGRDRDESQKIYSPIQTEPTDRRSVKVGLTQPLFTWGQVSAAIRAAEVGLKSADEQLRLYRQAALMDVSAAFYDVLHARDLHALALHNLEQKKRHLEEARRRYQVGVATDYDVL